MLNLVEAPLDIVVPKDRITHSVVYMQTPNQINYVGLAVIALTDEVLWVGTPGRSYDLIPLQNITEAPEVKEFRGFGYSKELYGQQTYILPQDTWGVVVKYRGLGNIIYAFSFITFYYPSAAKWQGYIQYAIARLERQLFSLSGHGG